MNFFHNKIVNPTGDGPTWDEWLQKQLKEASTDEDTKVASEAKPECDSDARCQDKGQVINNDNEEGANSYQEGESVSGKPNQAEGKGKAKAKATESDEPTEKEVETDEKVVEAKCGKEMGESDDAGKVTEKHTDAAPGDDSNPEPKVNINNDPNYQKGESTNPGKVKGKNKKTEATSQGFKKVGSMTKKEKLALFASWTANKKNPIEYCEAMVGIKFANLTQEEKEWFRQFWLTMYPPEYVENMVADR